MALTPQNNDAFLREVDEELRRDRLNSFWTRWGLWIAGAVLIGLALFGGYLYRQHRQSVEAGVEGEQLQTAYDALAAQDAAKATEPLSTLASDGNEGYKALAKFTQADILLQQKNSKAAAAKFAEIAADASYAAPFRNLALVRQTAAEFDNLKPGVVIARLGPLAMPGSAWLGSAGEMVALSYLKMGRRDQAGQMFVRIARDEAVPETIRQRAVQMAGVTGADAAPVTEGTKTP